MSAVPDIDTALVQIQALVTKQGAFNRFTTGTITDPDSFNAAGGKTGDLGYYPLVRADDTTIYFPCYARLIAGHDVVPEPTTATLTDTDGTVLTDADGATLIEPI